MQVPTSSGARLGIMTLPGKPLVSSRRARGVTPVDMGAFRRREKLAPRVGYNAMPLAGKHSPRITTASDWAAEANRDSRRSGKGSMGEDRGFSSAGGAAGTSAARRIFKSVSDRVMGGAARRRRREALFGRIMAEVMALANLISDTELGDPPRTFRGRHFHLFSPVLHRAHPRPPTASPPPCCSSGAPGRAPRGGAERMRRHRRLQAPHPRSRGIPWLRCRRCPW